jgi:hypothetical protein
VSLCSGVGGESHQRGCGICYCSTLQKAPAATSCRLQPHSVCAARCSKAAALSRLCACGCSLHAVCLQSVLAGNVHSPEKAVVGHSCLQRPIWHWCCRMPPAAEHWLVTLTEPTAALQAGSVQSAGAGVTGCHHSSRKRYTARASTAVQQQQQQQQVCAGGWLVCMCRPAQVGRRQWLVAAAATRRPVFQVLCDAEVVLSQGVTHPGVLVIAAAPLAALESTQQNRGQYHKPRL